MDNEVTRVIFRKFRDHEIIALFPDLKESFGNVMSYMHVGQHGVASRGVIWYTHPAAPHEYADLLHELTHQVGYKLKVIKRWPR